jgi:hypothetical protein
MTDVQKQLSAVKAAIDSLPVGSDAALLAEAQRAHEVGFYFLAKGKDIEARCACVHAEGCLAVLQREQRDDEQLRAAIEATLGT